MIIEDYLPQEALCFKSYEDAAAVQKILLENDYCVMMSREENFWMLNWIGSVNGADRNDVIFIDRANYEFQQYEEQKRREEQTENSGQ